MIRRARGCISRTNADRNQMVAHTGVCAEDTGTTDSGQVMVTFFLPAVGDESADGSEMEHSTGEPQEESLTVRGHGSC